MRLSADDSRDEELALETIAAAAEAGITVFDTARAYGRDANELGHNERLLARGLRRCGADGRARIVTKGGMTRTGGAWIPDGRAKAIRADCEAGVAAVDGLANARAKNWRLHRATVSECIPCSNANGPCGRR